MRGDGDPKVMRSTATAARALAMALAIPAASCAAEQPAMAVRYAPGFAPGGASVSVFGVFLNGRMSAEAWSWFEPTLSAALRSTTCEAMYTDRLQQADLALYEATDERVKSDGITDEMLERFAQKAAGDLIVTITVHGRVRGAANDGDAQAPRTVTPRPVRRGAPGAPRGRGRPSGRSAAGGVTISALLFSPRLHRSVGKLSMRYTGASLDTAITRFGQQLGAELSGSTCRGWTQPATMGGDPPYPPAQPAIAAPDAIERKDP